MYKNPTQPPGNDDVFKVSQFVRPNQSLENSLTLKDKSKTPVKDLFVKVPVEKRYSCNLPPFKKCLWSGFSDLNP